MHSAFYTWPQPATRDTLATYAEKIFKLINDDKATIAGLSFGGMLATEIAKNHPQTNVIIISSSKTYKEVPAYLRFWRYLPLYKLHGQRLKKYSHLLPTGILGVSGEAQKHVQRKILQDSDPAFTRWAIHAILHWKNITIPANVTHIHGTADNLLPYKYVTPHHTLQGGAHLMIMDRAAEISELLKRLIGCKEK